MSQTQRIVSNTAYLYFRMGIILAVSLYTVRVILDALGATDYGIYGVAFSIVGFFTFITGALSVAAQRYLALEIARESTSGLCQVWGSILCVSVLVGATIVVFVEISQVNRIIQYLNIPIERYAAAQLSFRFALIAAAIAVLQVPFIALITSFEKMWFFSVVGLIEAGTKLAVSYFVSGWEGDRLIAFTALLLATSLMMFFLQAGFCILVFPVTRKKILIKPSLIKEMAAFAGWNLFGNFAAICRNQGSNILLNVFFGPIANAGHNIMSQAQSALGAFLSSFQTATASRIYQAFGRKDSIGLHSLVIISCKASYMLALLAIAPIYYGVEIYLELWLVFAPLYSVQFVKGILFVVLIDALTAPLITAASATGRVRRYQIVIGTVLISTLPITYAGFLVTQNASAFLYVLGLTSVLAAALRLWFLRSMISLDLANFAHQVLRPMAFVSAVTGVGFLWIRISSGAPQSIDSAAFGSVAMFICVLCACLAVGVSSEERRALFKVAAALVRSKDNPC